MRTLPPLPRRFRVSLLAIATLLASGTATAGTRLKELVDVPGMRDNALFGYGLVVGLPGTGDTESVFFTSQTVSAMLGRLGIRVDPRDVRSRNVAAVMVTAQLPSYLRPGARLDVTVSALGNARSLSGGTLLITPLSAADGEVYAVAQGALQVGGFEAGVFGSGVRKNTSNSGRIPGGATVEKAVAPLVPQETLQLTLKRPDFTNAARVARALDEALGPQTAHALDAALVEVKVPEAFRADPVALIARLEAVEIDADVRAKVVVSERTGTVVAGGTVRLRPAAVSHGSLRVTIASAPVFSQPSPFGRGDSLRGDVAAVRAEEVGGRAVALPGTTTVEELVNALNLLGATPRDLISILQALEAAGALDAELEVLG